MLGYFVQSNQPGWVILYNFRFLINRIKVMIRFCRLICNLFIKDWGHLINMRVHGGTKRLEVWSKETFKMSNLCRIQPGWTLNTSTGFRTVLKACKSERSPHQVAPLVTSVPKRAQKPLASFRPKSYIIQSPFISYEK